MFNVPYLVGLTYCTSKGCLQYSSALSASELLQPRAGITVAKNCASSTLLLLRCRPKQRCSSGRYQGASSVTCRWGDSLSYCSAEPRRPMAPSRLPRATSRNLVMTKLDGSMPQAVPDEGTFTNLYCPRSSGWNQLPRLAYAWPLDFLVL
ncbi:hypothetical protein BJ546DRAFT_358525 [Cryomyces antarcticus]